MGYDSPYLTTSLGTMGLMLTLMTISFILVIVLSPLSGLQYVQKFRNKLKNKLQWNFTIRLFLEGLLETTFSSAITLTYVEKETFGDVLNFLLAIFLLLIVAALTIFVVVFYLNRFQRMSNKDDKQFKKTFGAAYEGLKINKKMSLF